MPAGATQHSDEAEKTRIMLGLLESVERDGGQSQRRLASELGIALGLVNAYLKRCVKKGLVKVGEAPARRYAYYLTPHGFSEKSRLTLEYLSYSFGFFRQAKADCALVFSAARERGMRMIVLAGKSDLAEIAALSAIDTGVTIAAVVDWRAEPGQFVGRPLVAAYDHIVDEVDGVIVTDLADPQKTYEGAIAKFGSKRVLVPNILRMKIESHEGGDQ